MTTKEYIDEAEQHLLHTYNRYQIVLEKGDGVYLYDTDGKKYLDFAAGIAVFAFGYNNQEYNDALKGQTGTITGIIYNRNHDNFCVSFKFNTKRTDIYYNTEDLVRLW